MTKSVIPPDAGPYGVDILTAGTPLVAGVREAGDLHSLGASRFSKFVNHGTVDPLLNAE